MFWLEPGFSEYAHSMHQLYIYMKLQVELIKLIMVFQFSVEEPIQWAKMQLHCIWPEWIE